MRKPKQSPKRQPTRELSTTDLAKATGGKFWHPTDVKLGVITGIEWPE